MLIRRIAGGALTLAVIAGGGVALAPSAFALPRQCDVLVGYENYWWNQYMQTNSSYAAAQFNQAAINSVRAGC